MEMIGLNRAGLQKGVLRRKVRNKIWEILRNHR